MKLRIVAYAINGRGLGHLTRQLAILRWIRRYCALLNVELEAWVLTSSEADTLARREGFPALKIPSKAMMRDAGLDPARLLAIARAWVLNAVATLQPDLLLVDTFPGGSFGELGPVLELARRRVLIARPVRPEIEADPAYQSWLPLYDAVIVPDDGGMGPVLLREREELLSREAARSALGLSGRSVFVSLGGGGDPAAPDQLPRLVQALRARDWEVVVGAGPLYEGPEIRGQGIVWLDRYAPSELFRAFDAAVSAGGYNTLYELMFAGVPTVFLPQPRLADDQEGRAERAVAAGAGRLARTLDEVPTLLEELLADPGAAAAALAFVKRNSASEVAATALSTVLPAEDVRAAKKTFTPAVLGLLTSYNLTSNQGMELLRLLAGEAPSAAARRGRALTDAGYDAPATGGSAVERLGAFLEANKDIPPDISLNLLAGLSRRFPAARPREILSASERLFPAWRRLAGQPADWMSAVSLLRGIPTQRQLPLSDFVPSFAAWLDGLEDPYEGLRALSALERNGARPLGEVLRLLVQGQRG